MNQRTRIKICGVSREADVDAAVDAGADAVGFVFHPESPRCLTVERATRLADALPPYVTPVGLFVNASPDDIDAALDAIPTLLLQFHGDETPEDCALFGRPYLRAARMTPELDLLDFARRFSEAEGILRVRPWAVDISSGVESSRGVKDAAAIRRFCDAVREADARIAASIA